MSLVGGCCTPGARPPGFCYEDVLRKVRKLRKLRNIVTEMVAELEAVKPIRAPDRALQRTSAIKIAFTDLPGRASAAA